MASKKEATLSDVVAAIAALGEQLQTMHADMADMRVDMRDGFDRVLMLSGAHYRELERRITKLERKAG